MARIYRHLFNPISAIITCTNTRMTSNKLFSNCFQTKFPSSSDGATGRTLPIQYNVGINRTSTFTMEIYQFHNRCLLVKIFPFVQVKFFNVIYVVNPNLIKMIK